MTGVEKGGVERRRRECREIGDEEMWGNVERECQRGLVIGGGCLVTGGEPSGD